MLPEHFVSNVRASVARFLQSWAAVGRRRPTFGRMWPILAKFGRTRPNPGHFRTTWGRTLRPEPDKYSEKLRGEVCGVIVEYFRSICPDIGAAKSTCLGHFGVFVAAPSTVPGSSDLILRRSQKLVSVQSCTLAAIRDTSGRSDGESVAGRRRLGETYRCHSVEIWISGRH